MSEVSEGVAYPGQIPLREVRAAGAFRGERFWTLLWASAKTEFKARYEHLVLGILWALLRPLGLAVVIYFLFTVIARFDRAVEYYPAMLVMNMMLFFFFMETVSRGMRSMVRNERLVLKGGLPRAVIPLSIVLTQCLTLAASLIVIAGFFVVLEVPVRATWALFPVLVLLLILLSIGATMLVAALYPRFRDLEQIWALMRRPMLFVSAVIFPIEALSDDLRWVVFISPLTAIMVQARKWMIDPSAPGLVDVTGIWGVVGTTLMLTAICCAGVAVLARRAPRIAEDL